MQSIPTWVLAAVWFATQVTRPELEHSAVATSTAAGQFVLALIATLVFLTNAPARRWCVRCLTGGEEATVLAWPIYATACVYLIEQVVLASYTNLSYDVQWRAPIAVAFSLVVCVAALGKLDAIILIGLLVACTPGSAAISIESYVLLPLEAIGWSLALGSPGPIQKAGYAVGFLAAILAVGLAGSYPEVTQLPSFDYRHSVPINVFLWALSTVSGIVLAFRLGAPSVAAAAAVLVPVQHFLQYPSDIRTAGAAIAGLFGLCILALGQTGQDEQYTRLDRDLDSPTEEPVKPTFLQRIPWSAMVLFTTTVAAIYASHHYDDSYKASSDGQSYWAGTKVAVLVETRNAPLLTPTISHYLVSIPQDWPVVLWVTDEIRETLLRTRLIAEQAADGRVVINTLPDEQISVLDALGNTEFMTRPWFWQQHMQEFMFYFQSDGVLCSASNTTLDDWLGYTWVGAPTTWSTNEEFQGAGGAGAMSIRHVPTMLAVTTHPEITRPVQGETEDVWFVRAIHQNFEQYARWPQPSDRDQAEFACSENGRETTVKPLIFHSGCGSGVDLEDYCPELGIVRSWERHVKGWPAKLHDD